ncbi:MAG: PIN domain-containing protein [Spirosomaceae bacterium]|jgi:predicted nucleic acid-binding protein|nr:PIN domain-containing protein [Spirosomataceae bacterium]
MAIEIFLDTNVVLDVLFERPERYAVAGRQILRFCELGKINGYISAASFYTITYYVQKNRSLSETKQILGDYLNLLTTLETSHSSLETGVHSLFTDLEDAYQYQTALAQESIGYFVTGNIKDYKKYQVPQLPIVTPDELLTLI